MYLLYSLQIGMLLLALFVLALPFLKEKTSKGVNYILLAAGTALFCTGLYQLSSDTRGLTYWFSQGKEHYELLEKFNALGGVDGAIKSIRKRLVTHPDDAQGWELLGKLYLSKNDLAKANAAFASASRLRHKASIG